MDYKARTDLNTYEKIYWFLRLFIATDKGKLHQDPNRLSVLSQALGTSLRSSKEFEEADRVRILMGVVESAITKGIKEGTTRRADIEELVSELSVLLVSTDDFRALLFCIESILIPSGDALKRVPSKEATDIARTYAEEVLKAKGAEGLANILVEWDSITIDICLNKERDVVSKLMFDLRTAIETKLVQAGNGVKSKGDDYVIDSLTKYITKNNEPQPLDFITSAAVQEFERRLGQKRKQRSGNDLEDATSFIFSHFGFKGAEKPQHFNAGIEVDNWLLTKNRWYLGFSLKRTLRERWKQTRVDKDELTKFKVRYIIHLIGNFRDPTDAVIGDLGAQRHIFFVPDQSPVLDRIKEDVVLREYVKPMSSLIGFLKDEIVK